MSFCEIETEIKPAKRYDSAITTDNISKIYLFGGLGLKYRCFNDLWVFTINKQFLTKSFWSEIEIKSNNRPCKRYGSHIQYFKSQIFILFGKSDDGNYLNDIWLFNINNNIFKQIDTQGQTIIPNAFSTYNLYYNKLILFGGNTVKGISNRLYSFDLNNMQYRRIKLKGNELIEPRWRHGSCIIGDEMIIYGGFNKDDVFTFNLNEKLSDKERIVKKIGVKLPPVCECVMINYKNDMLIFGGYIVEDRKYIDDVIIFKGIENAYKLSQYKLLTQFGKSPHPRGRHNGIVCDGIAFIFGGYSYGIESQSSLYNDIWCYSFKNSDLFTKQITKEIKKKEEILEKKESETFQQKKRRLSKIYLDNLKINKAFNQINLLVDGLSLDDEKTPISSNIVNNNKNNNNKYENEFDKLSKALDKIKEKHNETDNMLKDVLSMNGIYNNIQNKDKKNVDNVEDNEDDDDTIDV